MSEIEKPNQSGTHGGQHIDYLKRAADACEAGDLVLGMHLYLAAYEKAAADPSIPDGMALSGLREAWHLACDLKERSIAEYVFEKLEPYLTGEEIAACAGKLQSLALDRLEEYGFSREELEGMAEMISQDFGGIDASVVKVESISIPNAGMFGVPSLHQDLSAGDEGREQVQPAGRELADDSSTACGDEADGVQTRDEAPEEEQAPLKGQDDGMPAGGKRGKRNRAAMNLADINDFNPYDQYRDCSIGKSYHAATNEGSGAEVFTVDEDRKRAHDRFVAGEPFEDVAGVSSASGQELDAAPAAMPEEGEVAGAADAAGEVVAGAADAASETAASSDSRQLAAPKAPGSASAIQWNASGESKPAAPSGPSADIPSIPDVAQMGAHAFNYRTLAGYGEAVAVMRDFGVGLQNDRGFQDFVAMLNQRHGLDRAPALDTMLFRAPVIEDAARFVEATIGELGLPALRMSMEEGMQGMPVLCLTTQGNNRPRMNHAHNRFEAPAVLVLEDLDMWSMPEPPENAEGIAGFLMANISRGAREAMNLIRSAVEDPDVFVLATATTTGEADPFFYELLEPLTVIDIGYPNDQERAEIWTEIARDHPSMRTVSRPDLMRFSRGLARYDIYMAARDAIEEAFKLGLVQRSFVPVTPQNIFEKLAACQPLESEEYRALEEEVIRNFQRDLERLEDLVDDAQD